MDIKFLINVVVVATLIECTQDSENSLKLKEKLLTRDWRKRLKSCLQKEDLNPSQSDVVVSFHVNSFILDLNFNCQAIQTYAT